ncbi:hypothetical protein SESBI_06247 [Sesbania bispinosa]|nr:hypothetical protein SESBI_06247 [Sesbania bispinosa]
MDEGNEGLQPSSPHRRRFDYSGADFHRSQQGMQHGELPASGDKMITLTPPPPKWWHWFQGYEGKADSEIALCLIGVFY